MRNAQVLLMAGLLAGNVLAQGTTVTTVVTTRETVTTSPKLLDLSRQLANGTEALLQQVDRGEPQSGKLEKRILNNLLGGGERRDARDPIYRDLDIAARDLASAAKDLSRRSGRRGNSEDERQFIQRFRTVERLTASIDRNLNAPTARGIFTNQVQPGVSAIRAELPTLSAHQDREDRREDRRNGRRGRN